MGYTEDTKTDKLKKYGFGSLRLLGLLLLITFLTQTRWSVPIGTTINFGTFGIGGAVLNLHVVSAKYQIIILVILIVRFILEYLNSNVILMFYLLKTVFGDCLAGKLDQIVWFRSITIAVITWIALNQMFDFLPNLFQLFQSIKNDFPTFSLHLICHIICETGDNYFEHLVFFRHRYSYELSCLVILFCNPSKTNLQLLIVDMIAALFYRFTNYVYNLLKHEN